MLLGLGLRVWWTCLLLWSSAAGFPATKGDYKYPYTASRGSSGGPAPGSDLRSEGPHRPLVSLRYEASAPAVNWFPSNEGAPGVAEGSSTSSEPNWFVATGGSSFNGPLRAPAAPARGAGASPPMGAGAKLPSFSVRPQTGNSDVDSGVAAFSPVYEAPSSGFVSRAEPAGNTAAAYNLDGPVPYAPETSGSAGFSAPSYGNPSGPGLPWAQPPVWGPDSSFYDPGQASPDSSAWDSAVAAPQGASETSPLAPSSYIIQSRNGYQRAREVLTHSRYSPEYPEPPVFPFRASSESAAAPGSKGGPKV